MPDLLVETTEGIELRYELAGPGSRSAAAILDAFLLAMGFLALLVLVAILGGVSFVLLAGALVIVVAYQVGFGILADGQTPGKKALGIRVVDQEGIPASRVQHVLRGLFFPLEAFVTVPVPLGVIVMAATPRRQRLGDLVAGTVVVRESRAYLAGELEAVVDPARRSLGLVPAHRARFDAFDQEFVRGLLSRSEIDPAVRRRLFVKSARHYMERLGLERPGGQHLDLEPEAARSILREIYAFLGEPRAKRASLTAKEALKP